jgi:2',3'-cyclic-nucleotide 2'-phosphodiesterase (5'-nucleotidase family)
LLGNPAQPTPPAAGDLNKATTIMQAHGAIGLDAMAIGEAELAIGVAPLAALASRAGLRLLCANLVDARGQRPFAENLLVDARGVKVGLFALFEASTTAPDVVRRLKQARLRATDAVAAATAQVKALRAQGAEVIVMLAHVGMPRAKEIAQAVRGIHVGIVAHSGFRTSEPERVGKVILVEPGRRGQELGHLELRLGEGWTVQEQLVDDSRRHVLYLEASAEAGRVRKGLATASNVALRQRIVYQAERARHLARQLEEQRPPQAKHTVIARLIELDEAFPNQPTVQALLSSTRATWFVGTPPVPSPPRRVDTVSLKRQR